MHPALLLAALLLPQEPVVPPRPTGYVSDFAEALPAAAEAEMTRLIEQVRAGSRGEIAIVTLRDIGGRDVGDVALAIGRAWGVGATAAIGDRARNAGVVVLLVPRETSADGRGYISIQVGQGAEGFIPDAVAGDIRREATPLLEQGDYGGALTLITARLAERYGAEFGFVPDSTLVPPRHVPQSDGIPPVLILLAFLVLVSVLNGLGGRRRRRLLFLPFLFGGGRRGGWGGGGFGGGGFGGGGFGGGGFGSGGFGGFGGGGGFSGGGSSGRF
ncbi:MAG: TPM domain-containing protein [Gemmatimonadaceae bacterium]